MKVNQKLRDMKNVIRDEQGNITHMKFCVDNGKVIFVNRVAEDKLRDLSRDQVDHFYCGDAEDEVNSLKEDVHALLIGALDINVQKFRIARSLGIVSDDEIIEEEL